MEMLLKGALIGLSIAIPPGPNAAMCISRTFAAGRGAGLRCGLGAASAHAIYAVLAVVGVGRASSLVSGSTVAMHLAGGLILVALGLRLVRTAPLTDRGSTKGAYMTTLAVGLGNPLTILYFTAAMAVGTISADAGALAVVGVFAGSALWWAALAYAVSALQHHLSERRLGWARRLTGSAIGGCGLMAVAVAL